MKKAILLCLGALALLSCKKAEIEGPLTTPPVNQVYTSLNIKTSPQLVKLFVTGDTLKIVYNEDLTLIVDSDKLAQKDAVHFKEDFTGTTLANFTNPSLSTNGANASGSADDNLNNIVHSSKDTLIAGKRFVQKKITRSLTYQKVYTSADDAHVAQNQLLKQVDIITFSAYFSPTDTQTAATFNTAKLTYVKM